MFSDRKLLEQKDEELQQHMRSLRAKEASLIRTNLEISHRVQELETRLQVLESELNTAREEVCGVVVSYKLLKWNVSEDDCDGDVSCSREAVRRAATGWKNSSCLPITSLKDCRKSWSWSSSSLTQTSGIILQWVKITINFCLGCPSFRQFSAKNRKLFVFYLHYCKTLGPENNISTLEAHSVIFSTKRVHIHNKQKCNLMVPWSWELWYSLHLTGL